jgi:hypothetical protein
MEDLGVGMRPVDREGSGVVAVANPIHDSHVNIIPQLAQENCTRENVTPSSGIGARFYVNVPIIFFWASVNLMGAMQRLE